MDGEKILKTGICIVVAATLTGTGMQIYSSIKAHKPNPPVYRDVNGDGIEDKIIQREVRRSGLFWTTYPALQEEVFYGVDINGKKIYLPKEQFDEVRKENTAEK